MHLNLVSTLVFLALRFDFYFQLNSSILPPSHISAKRSFPPSSLARSLVIYLISSSLFLSHSSSSSYSSQSSLLLHQCINPFILLSLSLLFSISFHSDLNFIPLDLLNRRERNACVEKDFNANIFTCLASNSNASAATKGRSWSLFFLPTRIVLLMRFS